MHGGLTCITLLSARQSLERKSYLRELPRVPVVVNWKLVMVKLLLSASLDLGIRKVLEVRGPDTGRWAQKYP